MNASQTTPFLKQGRDGWRRSRQHEEDTAELRRRRCVEPADLAITDFDPTGSVSDLQNGLDHTIHLSGELVPFGSNSFVLGLQTTICFEQLQGFDPIGELLPGFVHTI